MVSAVRGCASRIAEDLLAAEAAGLAEEGLFAIVVLAGALDELPGLAIHRPAGESARRGLDIGLGVVALAQGEEPRSSRAKFSLGCRATERMPSR